MKNKTMWTSYLVAGVAMAIVAFLLARPDAIYSEEEKEKSAFRGCRQESWEPEVISLYGDPATVLAKIDKFKMRLPKRRIYLFLAESDDSAELALFELAEEKENKFQVWHWKGRSAAKVREEATNTILATRGVLCVGKQIKELVMSLDPKDKGTVPAPTSASAAFGHAIRGFGKGYIRTTAFLLC